MDFVTEMKRLLSDSSNERKYLFTASPICFLPNRIFDETLQKIPEAFDSLYVSFADQSCTINDETKFMSGLNTWVTDYGFKGPKIYIGLPSGKEMKHYGDRQTVKKVFDVSIYSKHQFFHR